MNGTSWKRLTNQGKWKKGIARQYQISWCIYLSLTDCLCGSRKDQRLLTSKKKYIFS